ncbi:MAG: M48 family metalloprotease [Bdellovibrionales bacterium]|nr:M48 family metalloprotease [Bdellovibrionales bacterium]
MGNPSTIQLSVWICLAGITGVPFYFKNWLDRTRPILAEQVQNKTTRLSTLIFGLLFLGGFIFNRQNQGAAMVLLFAAVISFSFLYQFAGRYQISMNRQKREPLAAHGASIRKNASRLVVGATLCFLMSKVNLLVLVLPLAIPFFMPLFVRLQHACAPMADSPLKQQILAKFTEEEIPLSNIYLIDDQDSNSKNAFITGSSLGAGAFGQTLFLTLPLIQELNETEILAVALHEAAHAKRHHATKRILLSIALMVLCAFWITVPLAFLFPKNFALLGASIFGTVFAQALFLSKVITRQELEADLMAVRMGASSNALIEAIRKLSGQSKASKNPVLRVLSGNLYPTTDSRIEEILSCGASEKEPVFSNKPAVLAYSLLVLGVVFWASNVRAPQANVSHSEGRIVSR